VARYFRQLASRAAEEFQGAIEVVGDPELGQQLPAARVVLERRAAGDGDLPWLVRNPGDSRLPQPLPDEIRERPAVHHHVGQARVEFAD
jgi:hypothetical protein